MSDWRAQGCFSYREMALCTHPHSPECAEANANAHAWRLEALYFELRLATITLALTKCFPCLDFAFDWRAQGYFPKQHLRGRGSNLSCKEYGFVLGVRAR